MVRALSHVLFYFNPGPVWRVPIPNRYTAKAKLCFCKNNKRTIIMTGVHRCTGSSTRRSVRRGHGVKDAVVTINQYGVRIVTG